MGASLSALDPGLADAARALDSVVHASGLQGRFTSTVRTGAEQARLYRRFLAGQSEFPAVPPGASAHEYGLAFDYVVSPYQFQSELGALWSSWGGGWSQSDAVHFELPGASAAVMQQYNASLSVSGPESSERTTAQEVAYFLTDSFGPFPWWSTLLGAPSYRELLADVGRIPSKYAEPLLNLYYRLFYTKVD